MEWMRQDQAEFDAALALYRRGVPREAKAFCHQFTSHRSQHPESLNLPGVIRCQHGRQVVGSAHMAEARCLKPLDAESHNNSRHALLELCRHFDRPLWLPNCSESCWRWLLERAELEDFATGG